MPWRGAPRPDGPGGSGGGARFARLFGPGACGFGQATALRVMGSSGASLTLRPCWRRTRSSACRRDGGSGSGGVAAKLVWPMGSWWVSTWAAPPPMSSACQRVLALRMWQSADRDCRPHVAAPRLPIHTVAAGGGSILSAGSSACVVGPRSAARSRTCVLQAGRAALPHRCPSAVGALAGGPVPGGVGTQGDQPLIWRCSSALPSWRHRWGQR